MRHNLFIGEEKLNLFAKFGWIGEVFASKN